MTFAELWLTYQLASRAHLKNSSTTQLIELEFQNHKLSDLEDVLEHVFRQGFVEPKYRPLTWWERNDGQKVKASHSVEDLLLQGVGRCPENALKLVVQDVPAAVWITYVYHHHHNAATTGVAQRIKLAPGPHQHGQMELLANITNHIFKEGFLAPKLRPVVHWEDTCGKKLEEHLRVQDVLSWGEGMCEDKPLRLVIDAHNPEVHSYPGHHHHDHSRCGSPTQDSHCHGVLSPKKFPGHCGHCSHTNCD